MVHETGKKFFDHKTVNHGEKQWRCGYAYLNTVKGFSVFKCGMVLKVYQHCSEKHLHCYLAEVDFRYLNRVKLELNDIKRAHRALGCVGWQRLTCQTTAQG